MLETRTEDGCGPDGTAALQPYSQRDGGGKYLVASDHAALNNVENLHGLSRNKGASGLGLDVGRGSSLGWF